MKTMSRVINAIFKEPTHPFWTGRVMDLLFDGIDIDCTTKDFMASTTCDILLDEVSMVDTGPIKGILKFSFFKYVRL